MVLHLHTLPCHRCGTVTPHVADKPNHALHLGLTLLFTMFLGIVGAFVWGIVWFVLKATFVFFMFAMVKAFVPRYRYDQLMRLGWKVFLPISLFMVVLVAAFLQLTGLA